MVPATLVLTIGRRPELLAQTLESLLPHQDFAHIVAINDFGDEATNIVFRERCPNGVLISLDSPSGHHAAIDRLYQEVRTPYVFHCEDDWLFESAPDIQTSMAVLASDNRITSVCFRRIDDFGLSPLEAEKIISVQISTASYSRLDGLHPQWHGYTFNPHLLTATAFANIGNFSRFKKERHISRWLRKQGKFVAYLNPGSCRHIGMDCSVSIRPSFKERLFKKISRWIGHV